MTIKSADNSSASFSRIDELSESRDSLYEFTHLNDDSVHSTIMRVKNSAYERRRSKTHRKSLPPALMNLEMRKLLANDSAFLTEMDRSIDILRKDTRLRNKMVNENFTQMHSKFLDEHNHDVDRYAKTVQKRLLTEKKQKQHDEELELD